MTAFDLSPGFGSLGPQSFSTPYGDRIAPLAEALRTFHDELPDGTLIFDAPNRDDGFVVLNCPVTRAPMTQAMATEVGLNRRGIQLMVDRKVPLGITPNNWRLIQADLFRALDRARIPAEDVTIKIGGSSTHGFSSRATTMRKKIFPGSVDQVVQHVGQNAAKTGLDRASTVQRIEHAVDVFHRATQGLSRIPRSPWWGILHRMGLEDAPDIDVQIHSDHIDGALHDNQRAVDAQHRSLWHQWPDAAVDQTFPVIATLRARFQQRGIPVGLEFLANDEGRSRISTRGDWWPIQHPEIQSAGLSL